jgi:hypothetical protein
MYVFAKFDKLFDKKGEREQKYSKFLGLKSKPLKNMQKRMY